MDIKFTDLISIVHRYNSNIFEKSKTQALFKTQWQEIKKENVHVRGVEH
jgi:hypothetical protein